MVSIPSHPALCQIIAAAIATAPQQRIPFAQFMDLALYHPDHGYYSRGAGLGPRGDFVTATHLGHDFGELIGVQILELWHHLGQPHPFDLVEVGPGEGQLAADLCAHLSRTAPDCWRTLRYTLIEASPTLRQRQRQRLTPWLQSGSNIHWQSWDQVPAGGWTGCVISNELVDAFPVHRVVLTETGLQEQYVTLTAGTAGAQTPLQPQGNAKATPVSEQAFGFQLGPLSTPALAQYFQDSALAITAPAYPVGYTTEVNLAALAWIEQVAQTLQRGYVITIDYGYEAPRYYQPARSQGTLQCYWQQAHHDDPLIGVGYQDLTAHVDFTALQRQGERCGLTSLGFTQQGLFLMALGLGDRLSALAETRDRSGAAVQQALQQRQTLHQLISPLGLGNFGVLVQAKGLTAAEQAQPLRGLTVPAWGSG
jgi:SAM-dependent MidA family methyltransferase